MKVVYPLSIWAFLCHKKKLRISQCMPVVDRITGRVKCWTSKLFTYAGRLQLIKSVVFSMQTYWAQMLILPNKIMKLIEQVCRTYLWTGSTGTSKRAFVSWEKVCQPRSAGGLNVMHLSGWNKAAILKLLWALASKKANKPYALRQAYSCLSYHVFLIVRYKLSSMFSFSTTLL